MVSAQASMPPSPSALVDATLLWGDGLDMSVPTSPLAGGLDGGASVLDALVTPSRKRKRMPLTAPGSAPAAPMVQDVAPSSFLDDLGGLFGSLDAVPELALASTMALASSVYDQLDGDLGLGLGDGSSGGGMVEPGVLGGAPSSLLGLAPPSESPLPSMHPSPSVSPAAPIPPPYTVLPSESYLPRPPRLALAAATADSDDYSDDDSDDRDFESYDDESSYGDEYGSSARSRHGGGRRLAGKGKSKGKSKSKAGKSKSRSKAKAPKSKRRLSDLGELTAPIVGLPVRPAGSVVGQAAPAADPNKTSIYGYINGALDAAREAPAAKKAKTTNGVAVPASRGRTVFSSVLQHALSAVESKVAATAAVVSIEMLGHRLVDGVAFVRIHYIGLPSSYDEWVPSSSLVHH
ncbi:uncharacterized protein AMSG_02731 [Thecamonas trahens ATCC 50062]|uniref:Chromo domain-containing protein n=1 Tax=Thecamonas trahens ATCC 50062 TaxID=461836 RepID=A0A0L0D4P6_THETB|nr:hypothetical protein AMSG_02731 [Thecamonas trahens ATCC 50062]KNC46278.1 hypothetical protein AMSG_02731 [Thecamonas trahens ATCC 50062]|eukprot:XP_013760572.1 hypothetical protein AMSG_02731 [Thecamonas trahens ATCC 50062]